MRVTDIAMDMPSHKEAQEISRLARDHGPASAILRGRIAPFLLRDELLSEIFGGTASLIPDQPCLYAGDQTFSYADVDDKATAMARGLVREGVRPGEVVGLWMPRGHELLIAQIAIAKTGAAWLPFDADAPLDRIAVCLEDCSARALLTSPAQAPGVEGRVNCDVLTELNLIDKLNTSIVSARALGATPDSPAYMIYTSGSTGVPKGIVITQRNICNYLR